MPEFTQRIYNESNSSRSTNTLIDSVRARENGKKVSVFAKLNYLQTSQMPGAVQQINTTLLFTFKRMVLVISDSRYPWLR